jgi:hypothetical protein
MTGLNGPPRQLARGVSHSQAVDLNGFVRPTFAFQSRGRVAFSRDFLGGAHESIHCSESRAEDPHDRSGSGQHRPDRQPAADDR